jgi:FlaA1/EpsC-like NDP-sugar epimerase
MFGEKTMQPLDEKSVLVTGGTGSLGQVLVRRLLSGELGSPRRIIIFSRDEAKQHAMAVDYLRRERLTGLVATHNGKRVLEFRIGDVRDPSSLGAALHDVDVVFNAAALKQVPSCEYFPSQAVMTNIEGALNIVRVIQQHRLPVTTVVGLSTDKACKPVNVMGMTKALQERVFIQANLECPDTRFVCVRYGNVLASRGSVVPLFHEQILAGGPVTITTAQMTRFLLSIDQAVDTIAAAVRSARHGEIYIPRIPSARVVDVAMVMIDGRPIDICVTGIRPGEKTHEILISEEECHRTVDRGNYYAIQPNLPELRPEAAEAPALNAEFSSADHLMEREELAQLLEAFIPPMPMQVVAPYLSKKEVGR